MVDCPYLGSQSVVSEFVEQLQVSGRLRENTANMEATTPLSLAQWRSWGLPCGVRK